MDVFDLYAKIRLDTEDYEKGLSGAKSKFSDFASGLKNAAGAVVDVLAGIGKTAVAGIGAASAALTAITKQSLDQVSQYEQMVGGVEKIFEGSAQKVIDFSHEAFETAGMSANEYMETITSFSASLIHSLAGDTEKAADLANQAIIDMSDNANVFGTDMQSVQYAYMGFAKQNYTMLDNLKLGYGGTAKEMARLLNESGVLGNNLINLDDTKGLNDAINEAGFAKIIEAIHVTQERLNITNTTANEAAKTLEGSARAMKAAWANFLTGVGTPEQFSRQIETSLKNIRANLNNIIPRITTGLIELADLLAPELPKIVEELLPSIITSSSSLITGLAERLPQLLTAILPSLAAGVVDVTTALITVLPDTISALKKAIPIVVQTIMSKKDELLKAGQDIFKILFPVKLEDIPDMMSSAASAIGKFLTSITSPSTLKPIGEKAKDILDALAQGLTKKETLDAIFDAETGAPAIIANLGTALVNAAIGLGDTAVQMLSNLADYFGSPESYEELKEGAQTIVDKIGTALTSEDAKNLLGGFIVEFTRLLANLITEGGVDWENDVGLVIAGKIAKGILDYTVLLPKTIADKIVGAFAMDDESREKIAQGEAFLKYGGGKTRPEWDKEWEAAKEKVGKVASFDWDDQWNAILDEMGYIRSANGALYDPNSGISIDDWQAAQALRDMYGDLPYSDSELAEYANSRTSLNFDEFFSDYERRRRYKAAHPDQYVPGFAEGGIVSKPTLAWIGERGEKEAVVPLEHETDVSRALGLGGMHITFGDIYVQGGEDAGRQFMQKVDEELRFWQIQQKRGVGGAAWQN